MRWQLRLFAWGLALVAGAFVLDQLVWTLRGSPVRQVELKVVTTIELKNHKEDYGPAETEWLSCEATLLPFPARVGWSRPCWWVERRREMVRRF